jgi:regulator of protease activity HflC (stomatin/prohibitin superfamily)
LLIFSKNDLIMTIYNSNQNRFNPIIFRNIILGVIALVFILVFSSTSFITIESGEKGVLFKKFGGGLQKDKIYEQGFHVVAPWNTMFVYNVRKQQEAETMDVLSSNGLSISVDVSIIYRPKESMVGYLHDLIGTDYFNTIVIPEIRSSGRKIIGRYTPEELYSTKREIVQTEIYEETTKTLDQNHIILDAILIRSVTLPATIKTAIESKLKQEQESLEYEFRIQKETKEAERKAIEAKGIQNFQKIVTDGISDKLLTWKGIEATNELAKSPNSKIIVVGSGKNGLPVILNTD